MTDSQKLLQIAGLTNAYHNDGTTLSAAETLRAIADVLGKPMEPGEAIPPGEKDLLRVAQLVTLAPLQHGTRIPDELMALARAAIAKAEQADAGNGPAPSKLAKQMARDFMDDGSPSGPDEYRTVSIGEVERLLLKALAALSVEARRGRQETTEKEDHTRGGTHAEGSVSSPPQGSAGDSSTPVPEEK